MKPISCHELTPTRRARATRRGITWGALFAPLACFAGLQLSPVAGYQPSGNVDERALEVFRLKVDCNGKRCNKPELDADGVLKIEGHFRSQQYTAANKAQAVGPRVVAREYAEAIKKLGGEAYNEPRSENGDFVFRLPAQSTWVVLMDNYDGYYTLITLEEQTRASTVTATQMADQLKAVGFMALYINFDTNRADLKADGQAIVKEIVALMKADPRLRVSIEGHTDNVGQAADNKKLSEARAQSVMKAVIAAGIDAKRLQAAGRGAEMPIADNRLAEGRAKNRRVELVKL
jgi:outer membrane protein OmpA-like peptidoglycan-associated protein